MHVSLDLSYNEGVEGGRGGGGVCFCFCFDEAYHSVYM